MPGVYLSYPFCRQKCTFCNFASGVRPESLRAEYAATLLTHVRAHSWSFAPETVYLGGGTPSSMPIDELAALLAAIPGKPWREATLEAAPGTITRDLAIAWQQLGINRVSLGVQSFVDRELRQTGRMHDAAMVEKEVALLRAAGIHAINIDLIAGLPLQTRESWNESLSWIERLQPEHVSVYIFEVDEDSRLGAEVLLNGKRYGAPLLPPEQLTVELYETAVDRLAALGIPRYEISNFARPGFESLHNLKYWRREPYVGFGSDAHSFDGMFRAYTHESPEAYVTERPFEGDRQLAIAAEERLFLGLRLDEGVLLSEEDRELHRDAIHRHVATGLLAWRNERLVLTRQGVLLSNEVFQDFLLEVPAE